MVYQDVTRNKNLSPAAKGLYAYLAAICGTSGACYPSVETIIKEMSVGKDTFYRHINALVAAGVVEKVQVVGEDGKFGRTVYHVTHRVVIHDFPFPQNRDTETRESINNNIKNNNKNILCSPDGEREREKEENPLLEPDKKTALVQDKEDFEKIYGIFPKKRGRARAFEYYRAYVGKGRIIGGTRYRLAKRQIYLAVASYVQQMEEAGTELQFYQNFSTFMNKTILDYLPQEGEHDI